MSVNGLSTQSNITRLGTKNKCKREIGRGRKGREGEEEGERGEGRVDFLKQSLSRLVLVGVDGHGSDKILKVRFLNFITVCELVTRKKLNNDRLLILLREELFLPTFRLII